MERSSRSSQDWRERTMAIYLSGLLLALILLLSPGMGMEQETNPGQQSAVVVYCATGAKADENCADIRRVEKVEYERQVDTNIDNVLGEFSDIVSKMQHMYQSIVTWTSDTPSLVLEISCQAGDCPPLPSITNLDSIVQTYMGLNCVMGKHFAFTCTRAGDVIAPCQMSNVPRVKGVLDPTGQSNTKWKLFESADSKIIDLPNPTFTCPDDGTYGSKNVDWSQDYPTTPAATDLELIFRFNKKAGVMIQEGIDVYSQLKSYNTDAIQGAGNVAEALETVKKTSVATLVVLGTGGAVGALGYSGITAQVMTGAIAGGINALNKNVQEQLKKISVCTPDTSAAPPVTCEFDWAELAGAVISGALVGALANYIGGSVCSYLQSKIPVAEVVKTIPQEMRTKVVQCIQGGGAQVIRRTFLEVFFDKDGKFLGEKTKTPTDIWESMLTAMFTGCAIESLGFPPYVRNGLEGHAQSLEKLGDAIEGTPSPTPDAPDPIRFMSHDSRVELLLSGDNHGLRHRRTGGN